MTISRRQWLQVSAAALWLPAAAGSVTRLEAQSSTPAGPFSLPPLPYAADALEPHLDAQTMTIHHDRHHAAYVNNLNAALAAQPELQKRSVEDLVANLERLPEAVRSAVRNQGGGHLNHTSFWTSLKPGGGAPPTAELGRAIDASFGSFAKCQEALTAAAVGVFGSGWAWLCVDRAGVLIIETTANQDNPLSRGHRPLLGMDVWEHAYYLKFQNRRRDYIDAWFHVVDWEAVQRRFLASRG